MFRTPDPPKADDFAVTAQYRYGILKFTVTLGEAAKPVWLHGVEMTAQGADGTTERFSFGIGAPIRMNPGGRTNDHWRPRTIDLEDASQARPTLSASLVAARRRREPVSLSPDVDVDDGFERVDGEYRLLPTSSFAHEIERNRKLRMDGLATREG